MHMVRLRPGCLCSCSSSLCACLYGRSFAKVYRLSPLSILSRCSFVHVDFSGYSPCMYKGYVHVYRQMTEYVSMHMGTYALANSYLYVLCKEAPPPPPPPPPPPLPPPAEPPPPPPTFAKFNHGYQGTHLTKAACTGSFSFLSWAAIAFCPPRAHATSGCSTTG